jgi:hypothetical protein
MTDAPEYIGEAPPAAQAPAIIELPPPAAIVPDERPAQSRRSGARKGRHYGKRPVADPRTARFDVRCTPAFHAKVQGGAEAAGLSLSAFVCAQLGDTPGPRVHRNPTELTEAVAQLAAQMGKPGGNLNQGSRALNQIRLAAVIDGTDRDRLADMLDDMAELHRQAIAEHRECLAAVMRLLGMRPDDDY